MSKYRKKPVVIESIQWNPFEMTRADVLHHFGLDTNTDLINYSYSYAGCLEISTLEGNMTVSEGDYIIRGVKGEYYPCKPYIFEATYEPVGEDVGDE